MNKIYIVQHYSEITSVSQILAACTTAQVAVDLTNSYLSSLPTHAEWKKIFLAEDVNDLIMGKINFLTLFVKHNSGGYSSYIQIKSFEVNELVVAINAN